MDKRHLPLPRVVRALILTAFAEAAFLFSGITGRLPSWPVAVGVGVLFFVAASVDLGRSPSNDDAPAATARRRSRRAAAAPPPPPRAGSEPPQPPSA